MAIAMLAKELTGKLSHKASAPSQAIGAEREAEPDRHQPDEQDDQRPDHRAVGAHRAEQHHGHPNSMNLQLARSRMCRAIGSAGLSPPRNSASAGRSASGEQDDQRRGDRRAKTMPARVIALDPVPAAGADILRGHRADRRADRHRRHLDIGPQLHRHAEGGDRRRRPRG